MIRRLAFGALALVALAGCGGASAPSGSSGGAGAQCTTPARFTFRLNWVLDTEQVPYYTALDKGWYRAACLEPRFETGRGSTDTVKLVANGSAQMGVADAVSIIPGQAEGLPVTAVGTVFQHNAFAIVIREGALTPEQKKADRLDPSVLYGKTFGAVTGGSPYVLWKAFVNQQHLDVSRIHQVTISAPGYAEMATGKVDFLANFFTAKAVLDGMNVPVKLIKGEDFGQKAYGLTYLVNNDWLKSNGDVVKRFLEVTARALQYTSQHPDEGVKIECKHNQALCQDDHTYGVNVEQYKETTPLYPNLTKGKPMLCMDPKIWQQTAALLKDTQVIGTVPSVDSSITNKYLSGC